MHEIVGAVKEVARDAGKEVLKEVLKTYQLRIRDALLNRGLVFPHGECRGDRGFKGRGWRTERQSFEFTDVFVSKSQLNRWVLEDDWTGIVFDVDTEGTREVFADSTLIKRQDGTKRDLRFLIGKNRVGKVVPIWVWIDKGWDEIGKELKETYGEEDFKGKVLLSDGEQAIEDHPLFKDMEHQRCLWHGGNN